MGWSSPGRYCYISDLQLASGLTGCSQVRYFALIPVYVLTNWAVCSGLLLAPGAECLKCLCSNVTPTKVNGAHCEKVSLLCSQSYWSVMCHGGLCKGRENGYCPHSASHCVTYTCRILASAQHFTKCQVHEEVHKGLIVALRLFTRQIHPNPKSWISLGCFIAISRAPSPLCIFWILSSSKSASSQLVTK